MLDIKPEIATFQFLSAAFDDVRNYGRLGGNFALRASCQLMRDGMPYSEIIEADSRAAQAITTVIKKQVQTI